MAFISRPPVGLAAAFLGALLLVVLLTLGPVVTSGSDMATSTTRYWWARLAPSSYAPQALRTAPFFFASSSPSYCLHPEDPPIAWATILAADRADSVFAGLAVAASPAGRLYALAGLAAIQSPRLTSFLEAAATDTSQVQLLTDLAPSLDTAAVGEIVSAALVRHWAEVLRDITSRRCAT